MTHHLLGIGIITPACRGWDGGTTAFVVALQRNHCWTGVSLSPVVRPSISEHLQAMASYFRTRIDAVIARGTIALWYAIMNQEFGGGWRWRRTTPAANEEMSGQLSPQPAILRSRLRNRGHVRSLLLSSFQLRNHPRHRYYSLNAQG